MILIQDVAPKKGARLDLDLFSSTGGRQLINGESLWKIIIKINFIFTSNITGNVCICIGVGNLYSHSDIFLSNCGCIP